MKKLIAILAIMIVIVGAVFATVEEGAQKDELKVTTTVKPVNPQFKLYGSASSATASTNMTAADRVAANTHAAAEVEGADNSLVTDGGLTLYFVIKQSIDSRWRGNLTLSVAATELEATITTGTGENAKTDTYKTATPTISALVPQNDIAAPTGKQGATRTTTAGTASVTVVYNGRPAAAADIASFSVNWPKDVDLPEATYTGYVSMTYTAP